MLTILTKRSLRIKIYKLTTKQFKKILQSIGNTEILKSSFLDKNMVVIHQEGLTFKIFANYDNIELLMEKIQNDSNDVKIMLHQTESAMARMVSFEG